MKTCPTCLEAYPAETPVCPRDGSALADDIPWSEGSVIRGKYRILQRVGVGGMATVYKAEHIHFQEICALKVIKSDIANDEAFIDRFMREGVTTRMLRHPNAVRVDDIDRAEDGRPFIVMEFLEGPSLHEVMYRERPFPHRKFRMIVKQVASALDAAHGLGIIHRDIKPANITIVSTPKGASAKVVDFGIATVKEARISAAIQNDYTLTASGMAIGTPAYMSPEQAMGHRGSELDNRSDLYSLAVVMYEMLTGHLPVTAKTEEQYLIAHAVEPPIEISTYLPDLPESVSSLIMRCLSKDPEQRPANGQAIIREMDHWETLERKPVSQPVPPPPPPPAKLPNMNRWAVAALAASLSLLATALFYFLHARSSRQAPLEIQTPFLILPTGNMLLVPAGSARLGPHNTIHFVGAFYVDKTEVSLFTYLQFCKATNRPPPPHIVESDLNLPVRNVDFEDARAFAAWAHKRLPTAVEWEKAARGTQGDRFPWGNELGQGMAKLPSNSDDTATQPAPVDGFPQGASSCGALNMVGNVWEWVDPAKPQIRGGSFLSYPPNPAWVYQGQVIPPQTKRPDVGFRCARNVR